MKRHKMRYPGVFYREAERVGGPGKERVYYVVFKKDGKVLEEKAGRQFQDGMTPARAARSRADRIEDKRLSRKEAREAAAEVAWTVDRLFSQYMGDKPNTKSFHTDRGRYANFLKPAFGGKEPRAIAPIDVHRLRIKISKTLKPKAVKNVLELLERIINFGVKKGLCPGLSFKIEMPQVNNLKTEDLTPEQLAALLEAIDQDHDIQTANFLKLALYTGMRRGELFKLKCEDVDFDRGFIPIRQPKGGKTRPSP